MQKCKYCDKRSQTLDPTIHTVHYRYMKAFAVCVCACVRADGRALAVGGMGADLLPRSILQQYDLRKDVWALLPPMPTPRYDANTHLLANKLYVAGTNRQCGCF